MQTSSNSLKKNCENIVVNNKISMKLFIEKYGVIGQQFVNDIESKCFHDSLVPDDDQMELIPCRHLN